MGKIRNKDGKVLSFDMKSFGLTFKSVCQYLLCSFGECPAWTYTTQKSSTWFDIYYCGEGYVSVILSDSYKMAVQTGIGTIITVAIKITLVLL